MANCANSPPRWRVRGFSTSTQPPAVAGWPRSSVSKATVRKMKQNLVWASVYNVLAIPVAAGVLYPAYGIMLRPEWSALLMSLSSIIVAVNAVLLKGVEDDLDELRSGELSPGSSPAT